MNPRLLLPLLVVFICRSQMTSVTGLTNHHSHSTKGTCLVAGATGYIGKSVVKESVKQGYKTIALVRDLEQVNPLLLEDYFCGAEVLQCDVENKQELVRIMEQEEDVKAVISCLASPTGTKREAYAIDYQATLNCLEAGQEVGASHFVLLSAFCVRRPLLQLQQAKLKFEAALTAQNNMTYSIVRPTAFFKSVSGQFEAMKKGNPYVVFGDGAVTRCNPISEEDLAEFMVDCITDVSRHQKIMNIGGPDDPLTAKRLGEMMQASLGIENPTFSYAPTGIFDIIINSLQWLADVTKSEAIEDAAETARIGKYYAVEDMLTTEPHEKYGKITMKMHYDRIAAEGQDPFTPVRATSAISGVLSAVPALGVAGSFYVAFQNSLLPAAVQTALAETVSEPLGSNLWLATLNHPPHM